MQTYQAFLDGKAQLADGQGFEPLWMPEFLFDFQHQLVDWALRRGRSAIFADTGLGKTPMQLVWAENVVRKTNRPVLILTPLAVARQTIREGEKFGIEVRRSRDGTAQPGITVSNYEQLHKFNPADFTALVCDESSILKHFTGATQKAVTRFASKLHYRLLCTATAAPNDYIELGTSAEALGEIDFTEMRKRFFIQDEVPHRKEAIKRWRSSKGCDGHDHHRSRGDTFAKLSYRVVQQGQWRLKGHAEVPFWRWVASWARACRMPSDLGFDDADFKLPALNERTHVIEARTLPDGVLFATPAFGLSEERDERRRTIQERCEKVAELVDHDRPAVVWVHLNAEGDLATKLIPDARQVKGPDSIEEKEQAYEDFADGSLRVLVTKPKIGAWGLNWQHCADVTSFASHSYEQYYQSVRRCWRFGQKRPVTVDIVTTKGEEAVMANMQRKAEAADAMFSALTKYMKDALKIDRPERTGREVEVPTWLQTNSS